MRLRIQTAEPWAPPHESFVPLPIPDPITFAIGERWLNRRLYPRQATILKVIFLRLDLLTDYDYMVIEEWEAAFRINHDKGLAPGTVDRMIHLKSHGHKWFREVLFVMGRRASKGYMCALSMSYVLWHYLSALDPQETYGIDRDKQLECLIYAGKKDQARDHLWADLVNVIQGGACYGPYISRPMGETLTLYAPADKIKRRKLAARGIYSGMDDATFKISPLPATPMSGRGGAVFMIGMDEMAHMINAGANRAADEVWKAATPALDQFKKDAFIACPSSPWEMIGQFYVEWQHSLEMDSAGFPVYPEILMLQLASWDTYEDWKHAPEIELFPAEFTGDLGEYAEAPLPRLPQFKLAIQDYDDEMRKLEKADPDSFAVERLAHWQTSLDAYLDPKKVAAMFDSSLSMTRVGTLAHYYKGHADPSMVNDLFGLAVAHTETREDGFLHVVFDWIHHWDPADAPDHTLDYVLVNEELWKIISGYPVDDFSFDQFNSAYFQADLTRKALAANLSKQIKVHIVPSTAAYNLRVAETFKVSLNQGWIHAPYYEQADLELRFLQFKNNKVTHQTAGPVQHDDVARAMMEVVFGLLERQVASFLMSAGPELSLTMPGGTKPWMHPNADDQAVLDQFAQVRMPRQGGYMGPARGRPDFPIGRGPFPRQPGRTPNGRGRGWH
jgi:hypothetical protein